MRNIITKALTDNGYMLLTDLERVCGVDRNTEQGRPSVWRFSQALAELTYARHVQRFGRFVRLAT